MMKVKEFVSMCKNLANAPTVYMYGTWGQPVTQLIIDTKAKQYPEWYTKERIAMLKKHIGKSYGFDCACMVKSILWGFNFDMTHPNGGAVYCSNGVKDTNANGYYALCTNKSADFSDVPVGALLHMDGHVGVYVGNGKCIECAPSHLNKVQYSTVMNITGNVKTNDFLRKWEHWGLLPYVDYSDNTPQKDTTEDAKFLLNNIYNILSDAKKRNLF